MLNRQESDGASFGEPSDPKSEEVKPCLVRFIEAIVSRGKEFCPQNRNNPHGFMQIQKPKIENLIYNKGVTGYQMHLEEGIKPLWPAINREAKEHIDQALIEDCAKTLSSVYGTPEKPMRENVCKLVSHVFDRDLGTVTQKWIVDVVATFAGDLAHTPVLWEVECWLIGLWLEDEHYEIDRELTLRRPRPGDFEREISTAEAFFMGAPLLRQMPGAIAELRFSQDTVQNADQRVREVFTALRLFRVGAVECRVRTMTPKSILVWGGGHSHAGAAHSPAYKYGLAESDIEGLRNFLARTRHLIPDLIAKEGSPSSYGPLDVALDRYEDALLKPSTGEARVASAVMCLEALFLKAEEKSELSYKLRLRSATLLRWHKADPRQVVSAVKKAYSVRSTYVHGSRSSEPGDKLSALCKQVLEYCRITLLIYVQLDLNSDKKKRRFLEDLDAAVLDDSVRDQFAGRMRNDVVVPF